MARPLTVTVYGNAQLDTAEFKSGTASLLLDGNGDYLSVSNSGGELTVTSSTWTIEGWLYPLTAVNEDYIVIATPFPASTSGNQYWALSLAVASTSTISFITRDYSQSPTGQGAVSWSLNRSDLVGAWHHIAITRNGSTLKLWFDGTLRATATSQTYADLKGVISSTVQDPTIGGWSQAGVLEDYYDGWIDELNITLTEKYTTTFTPATRFSPDDNTRLLLHFDGTDGSTTILDDAGVQGSANLAAVANLAATQNPTPSMVFLGNDQYTWDDTDTWDNITGLTQGNQDRWRAAEYLPNTFAVTADSSFLIEGEADLSAQFAVSASGERLPQGSADLSAQFALSAQGERLPQGSAQLASQFAVSAIGERLPQGSADLFQAFTVSATGERLPQGTAELSAQFNLSARGGISNVSGASDISSAFAMSAQGRLAKFAEIDLDNFAVMSVSATVEYNAAADLVLETQVSSQGGLLVDGSSDISLSLVLSAQGLKTVGGSAALNVDTAVQTAANIVKIGQADLAINTALSAAADNFKSADIDITLASQLSARGGLLVEPNDPYDYTWDTVPEDTWGGFVKDQWSAEGVFLFENITVVTRGGLILEAQVNLEAFSAVLALGQRVANGQANLPLSFAVAAAAGVIPSIPPINLDAEFNLQSDSRLFVGGRADLQAFSAVLSAGERTTRGQATLDLEFDVTAVPSLTINAKADLQAFGVLLSDGESRGPVLGQSALALQFAFAAEGDLKLFESDIRYRILAETRNITARSETRTYQPLQENRSQSVKSETGEYDILPESRLLEIEQT